MEKEIDVKIDIELRKTFANRLKRLRTDKDLTLEELAELLSKKYDIGVTYGSLGNYERTTRVPSLYVLSKIAEFFDVSSDYLLGISDMKNVNVLQTTMFDENNKLHNVKIGFDKNSDIENKSIKEIHALVRKLKELGLDFDKIQ